MGTTLTGTTPQDTYDSLIKVTDNGPLSGSLKTLTDGLGNDSALALSTGAARVTGTLAVTSGTISGTDAIAISALNTNTNGTTFALNSAGTVGIMTFLTASTERMRITAAGNVGVGTSSPSGKLHVEGGDIFIGASYGLKFSSTSYMTPENNVSGAEISTAGVFVVKTGVTPTERIRVTTDGLTFNGDTAAANALDDYEEGTWTMGLSFGGGTTGITYIFNTGNYTKIGRQVNVTGWVRLSSKGSSTGTARITGLPFTNGATSEFYTGVTFGYIDFISFADVPNAYVETNATTIFMKQTANAGAMSDLTDANFANNSSLMINATYYV